MQQVFNAAARGNNQSGDSLLVAAVRMGNREVVDILLKQGADPNLRQTGSSPKPEAAAVVVTSEPDAPPPEALETGKMTVMKPLRLKRVPQGKRGS